MNYNRWKKNKHNLQFLWVNKIKLLKLNDPQKCFWWFLINSLKSFFSLFFLLKFLVMQENYLIEWHDKIVDGVCITVSCYISWTFKSLRKLFWFFFVSFFDRLSNAKGSCLLVYTVINGLDEWKYLFIGYSTIQ